MSQTIRERLYRVVLSNARKKSLRQVISRIPRNGVLYWLCRRYADYYNGEGDTNMHRNGEVFFLENYLPRTTGVVVFDVGANKGEWTDVVLRFNPRAEVHCFEPCSSTFEKLIGRGFPPNVVCNNFALGSRSMVRQLYVYRETSNFNSFYPQHGKEPRAYQEAWVETIDGYCDQHAITQIEYLKIDVEGGEFDVLQGAAGMLSARRIHIVQFEYGPTYLDAGVFLKDVLQFVADFNYDVYKLLPCGLLPVTDYYQQLENFRHSNYVLMLRDGNDRPQV